MKEVKQVKHVKQEYTATSHYHFNVDPSGVTEVQINAPITGIKRIVLKELQYCDTTSVFPAPCYGYLSSNLFGAPKQTMGLLYLSTSQYDFSPNKDIVFETNGENGVINGKYTFTLKKFDGTLGTGCDETSFINMVIEFVGEKLVEI